MRPSATPAAGRRSRRRTASAAIRTAPRPRRQSRLKKLKRLDDRHDTPGTGGRTAHPAYPLRTPQPRRRNPAQVRTPQVVLTPSFTRTGGPSSSSSSSSSSAGASSAGAAASASVAASSTSAQHISSFLCCPLPERVHELLADEEERELAVANVTLTGWCSVITPSQVVVWRLPNDADGNSSLEDIECTYLSMTREDALLELSAHLCAEQRLHLMLSEDGAQLHGMLYVSALGRVCLYLPFAGGANGREFVGALPFYPPPTSDSDDHSAAEYCTGIRLVADAVYACTSSTGALYRLSLLSSTGDVSITSELVSTVSAPSKLRSILSAATGMFFTKSGEQEQAAQSLHSLVVLRTATQRRGVVLALCPSSKTPTTAIQAWSLDAGTGSLAALPPVSLAPLCGEFVCDDEAIQFVHQAVVTCPPLGPRFQHLLAVLTASPESAGTALGISFHTIAGLPARCELQYTGAYFPLNLRSDMTPEEIEGARIVLAPVGADVAADSAVAMFSLFVTTRRAVEVLTISLTLDRMGGGVDDDDEDDDLIMQGDDFSARVTLIEQQAVPLDLGAEQELLGAGAFSANTAALVTERDGVYVSLTNLESCHERHYREQQAKLGAPPPEPAVNDEVAAEEHDDDGDVDLVRDAPAPLEARPREAELLERAIRLHAVGQYTLSNQALQALLATPSSGAAASPLDVAVESLLLRVVDAPPQRDLYHGASGMALTVSQQLEQKREQVNQVFSFLKEVTIASPSSGASCNLWYSLSLPCRRLAAKLYELLHATFAVRRLLNVTGSNFNQPRSSKSADGEQDPKLQAERDVVMKIAMAECVKARHQDLLLQDGFSSCDVFFSRISRLEELPTALNEALRSTVSPVLDPNAAGARVVANKFADGMPPEFDHGAPSHAQSQKDLAYKVVATNTVLDVLLRESGMARERFESLLPVLRAEQGLEEANVVPPRPWTFAESTCAVLREQMDNVAAVLEWHRRKTDAGDQRGHAPPSPTGIEHLVWTLYQLLERHAEFLLLENRQYRQHRIFRSERLAVRLRDLTNEFRADRREARQRLVDVYPRQVRALGAHHARDARSGAAANALPESLQRAYQFARNFDDFEGVVELCDRFLADKTQRGQRQQWQLAHYRILVENLTEFGAPFAQALFKVRKQAGQLHQLVAFAREVAENAIAEERSLESVEMLRWFRDLLHAAPAPDAGAGASSGLLQYAWLHDVTLGEWHGASSTLHELANLQTGVQGRQRMLSLLKLSLLAEDAPDQTRVAMVDDSLNLLQLQRRMRDEQPGPRDGSADAVQPPEVLVRAMLRHVSPAARDMQFTEWNPSERFWNFFAAVDTFERHVAPAPQFAQLGASTLSREYIADCLVQVDRKSLDAFANRQRSTTNWGADINRTVIFNVLVYLRRREWYGHEQNYRSAFEQVASAKYPKLQHIIREVFAAACRPV